MSTLYDDETGSPDLKQVEEIQKSEESEVLGRAQQIELMANSGGFKLVESWLLERIEDCKQQLVDAKDLNTIRRLQQSAIAYSNVIGYVANQKDLVASSRGEQVALPSKP